MLDYSLNIIGSEWIIIIFVAIIVLLGTNRLPDVAKKVGKTIGDYKKARDGVQTQFKDFNNHNIAVNGPVQNERQKLEMISKSLDVDFSNKSDDELRDLISSKIGRPQPTQNPTNNP